MDASTQTLVHRRALAAKMIKGTKAVKHWPSPKHNYIYSMDYKLLWLYYIHATFFPIFQLKSKTLSLVFLNSLSLGIINKNKQIVGTESHSPLPRSPCSFVAKRTGNNSWRRKPRDPLRVDTLNPLNRNILYMLLIFSVVHLLHFWVTILLKKLFIVKKPSYTGASRWCGG